MTSFQELTGRLSTLTELLEGSGVTTDATCATDALSAWKDSRQFIATAITRPGSVLDYGCANGFLLRSLLEWTPHVLVPYGIDIDPQRLGAARDLFGGGDARFATPDNVESLDVPDGFDYVYWAIGDNVEFTDIQNLRWLQSIDRLCAATGRFIVGFYDTPDCNSRRLSSLERLGVHFTDWVRNPRGPEMIAWTDKAERTI